MKIRTRFAARERAARDRLDVTANATTIGAQLRSEPIEQGIFALLLVGLAWVPFWYGSNDRIAWVINAIVFPGLAALYEVSLLVRRKSHPMAITNFRAPALLFCGVLCWIFVQVAAWQHSPFSNSIWGLSASALASPVDGSISVNRDLTLLALIRLVTAASVLWLTLQLCRDSSRAIQLIAAVALLGAIYSIYGFVTLKTGPISVLQYPVAEKRLTSTFINPDSFGTYAAISLIATAGLLVRLYRGELHAAAGNWRLQTALLLDRNPGLGAVLLGAAFLILVALFLTGSRGSVVATLCGVVFCGLLGRRAQGSSKVPIFITFAGVVLAAAIFAAFGDALMMKLRQGGLYDENRFSVYLLTIRSIADAPILGYGYGTFSDVFPMYRDSSISALGVWEQAHNTYLEIFQGLGVPVGLMLISSVLIIVLRCCEGAIKRRRDAIVPWVAAGVSVIVAVDAGIDFGLQIQAVALTFVAILGAGAAQAVSSRTVLSD